jgi:hypothetical protein
MFTKYNKEINDYVQNLRLQMCAEGDEGVEGVFYIGKYGW